MALKPREIKQRRKENVQKRVSSRYQRRYQERAEGKTPEQQQAIQERMFGRMQERLGGIQGANPFGAGYDASMIAQAPTWQRPPAGPLGAGAGGGANAPQTGPGGIQPPAMPGPIPQGQTQPRKSGYDEYGQWWGPGYPPGYVDDGMRYGGGGRWWGDTGGNQPPPGGMNQMPGLDPWGRPLPWMQQGQQQNPFQGGGQRPPNPFGGQGRY